MRDDKQPAKKDTEIGAFSCSPAGKDSVSIPFFLTQHKYIEKNCFCPPQKQPDIRLRASLQAAFSGLNLAVFGVTLYPA